MEENRDQPASENMKSAVPSKRRLVMDYESTDSEEEQQTAEPMPSSPIRKKRRGNLNKLVKHMNEPIRPAPVPAVLISQLRQGIRLMERDDSVNYGSGLPALDAKAEGKQIVEEPGEALSSVQMDINLTMENVEEMTQSHLQKFDTWRNRRLNDKLSSIKTQKKLQLVASQEEQILKWAETSSIQEAMNRRDFLAGMLRETFLRMWITEKRANFDPTGPTASADSKIISQLEMDAFSLSLRVKVMRQRLEISSADSTEHDEELTDSPLPTKPLSSQPGSSHASPSSPHETGGPSSNRQ